MSGVPRAMRRNRVVNRFMRSAAARRAEMRRIKEERDRRQKKKETEGSGND